MLQKIPVVLRLKILHLGIIAMTDDATELEERHDVGGETAQRRVVSVCLSQ